MTLSPITHLGFRIPLLVAARPDVAGGGGPLDRKPQPGMCSFCRQFARCHKLGDNRLMCVADVQDSTRVKTRRVYGRRPIFLPPRPTEELTEFVGFDKEWWDKQLS